MGSTRSHHRAWPWWHGRAKCSTMNWCRRTTQKDWHISMGSRVHEDRCRSKNLRLVSLLQVSRCSRNGAYMSASVIFHMKSWRDLLDQNHTRTSLSIIHNRSKAKPSSKSRSKFAQTLQSLSYDYRSWKFHAPIDHQASLYHAPLPVAY